MAIVGYGSEQGIVLPPEPIVHQTISRRAAPLVWASQNDWMRYQDQIRQLYVDEDHTLDEVMNRMKTQHGFNAT